MNVRSHVNILPILTYPLVHIHQKKKIAAKIASVNEPLNRLVSYSTLNHPKPVSCGLFSQIFLGRSTSQRLKVSWWFHYTVM
jgi:hypothetical protein